MPIEFSCHGCGQLLRVPDASAGAEATCPVCSLTSPVPPAAASGEPPPQDPTNPYASPQSSTAFDTHASQGPIDHGLINVEFGMNSTWELFKVNIALLVGAHFLMLGINMAVSLLAGIGQVAITNFQGEDSVAAIFFTLFGNVATNLLQMFLGIGIARINLNVAQGKAAEIGMILSGGPYFLRILGGSILYALLIVIGLIALIVPGIYLGLKYWPFYYFIVDRDRGIGEAFALAGEYTTGNKLSSLWLCLISVGLGLVGLLLCCVGVIFTYPIISLLWAIGYLMMTNQPVHHAQQFRGSPFPSA